MGANESLMGKMKKSIMKREVKVLKGYMPELKKALKKLEDGKTPMVMDIYGTYYIFPIKKDLKKELFHKEKRLSLLEKRLKSMV